MSGPFRSSIVLFLALMHGAAVRAQAPCQPVLDVGLDDGFPYAPQLPGARALGMGQAFVAVADDATAAEANPAGLTALGRREFSAHARYSGFDRSLGNVSAETALASANCRRGLASLPPLTVDTTPGSSDSIPALSFAGLVYPLERWSLAGYFSQTQDFEGNSSVSFRDGDLANSYSAERGVDVNLWNVGFSVAGRITDRVSLGASVRNSRLEYKTFALYRQVLDDAVASPALSASLTTIDDHDDSLTFNVGLTFNQGDIISGGVAYRHGGAYDLTGRTQLVSCLGTSCSDSTAGFGASVDTPSSISAGIALRPTYRMLVALDLSRVMYSDVAEAGEFLEDIDDETLFNIGLEYGLTVGRNERAILLRGGLFSTPDSDGSRKIDSGELNGTLGVGCVINERAQIDFGARVSGSVVQTIVSFFYRL